MSTTPPPDLSLIEMTVSPEIDLDEAKRRYDRFVAPLEQAHRGEYVAVSETGDFVLAPTLDEVMDQGLARLGPGSVIYKVGQLAVGKWLLTLREG